MMEALDLRFGTLLHSQTAAKTVVLCTTPQCWCARCMRVVCVTAASSVAAAEHPHPHSHTAVPFF
eukprot:350136-Chlamydomonas_euryale.AAC.6